MSGRMMTFAVVGRNEEALLANALRQALEAARAEEPVWFVDSGSSDRSGEVAAALGVEVLRAPPGKGRAVAAALERCADRFLCLIDADIEWSEVNIPLALASALRRGPAEMLVGQFDWPSKRLLSSKLAVYDPLVRGLFPAAALRFGRFPLSGFRVLDTGVPLGHLPAGFGLEAHLNALFATEGRSVRLVELGRYEGPVRDRVRDKRVVSSEVCAALLDLAEQRGRLDSGLRPRWEAWVECAIEVLRSQPQDGEPEGDFLTRLAAAAARPLPLAHLGEEPCRSGLLTSRGACPSGR